MRSTSPSSAAPAGCRRWRRTAPRTAGRCVRAACALGAAGSPSGARHSSMSRPSASQDIAVSSGGRLGDRLGPRHHERQSRSRSDPFSGRHRRRRDQAAERRRQQGRCRSEKWRYSVARATLAPRVTASTVTALGPPGAQQRRRGIQQACPRPRRPRVGPRRPSWSRIHLHPSESCLRSRNETVSLENTATEGSVAWSTPSPGLTRLPTTTASTCPTRPRVWLLTVACLERAAGHRVDGRAQHRARPTSPSQTSATQTQLTWIVDSYTLVLACLLLPAGRHRRPVRPARRLLFGLVVFAAASFVPTIRSDSPIHADPRPGRRRSRVRLSSCLRRCPC